VTREVASQPTRKAGRIETPWRWLTRALSGVVDTGVRCALVAATNRLQARVVFGPSGAGATLAWPLFELYEPLPLPVAEGAEQPRWTLQLEHVSSSDDEGVLHGEPGRGVSLQLAGGYREERLVGAAVTSRERRPGSLSFFERDTSHRRELLDPARGAWSLTWRGPPKNQPPLSVGGLR
jgi:hypothetical protein